jgi:hypothetical protein
MFSFIYSMDGKSHFKLYLGLMIPYIVYLIYLQMYWTVLAIPILFLVVDPDDDHKFFHLIHRWSFSHSLLYPLLFWLIVSFHFEIYDIFLLELFCFPVVVHLIGDFKAQGEPVGSYLLSLYPFKKRMNNVQTKMFIIANIIIWIIMVIL